MTDLQQQFIDLANQRLHELGWNQTDLAIRMNAASSQISHYMSGRNCPKLEQVQRMFQAMGAEMSFVVTLKNDSEFKSEMDRRPIPTWHDKMDVPELFRAKVKAALHAKRWSTAILGEEMGISRQRVHQILDKTVTPSQDHVNRIAKALEVAPWNLLDQLPIRFLSAIKD